MSRTEVAKEVLGLVQDLLPDPKALCADAATVATIDHRTRLTLGRKVGWLGTFSC